MLQKKNKKHVNPILMFLILIGITILLSGILSLIGIQADYSTVNPSTNELVTNVVQVENLFSGHGIKSIATSAISDFVSFAPLSMIIIALIGIGVLERTGFLKAFFTLITKSIRKNSLTFLLIFFSVLSSFVGDIGYVVLLPLGALLFKFGKRNPLGGIIASFAGVSFGYGINIFLNANDNLLRTLTLESSHLMNSKYMFGPMFQLFISILAIFLISIVFTNITEKTIMPKLGKYENEDDIEIVEDVKITKLQLRGLIVSIGVAILYILLIIYMIIPDLPFSGALLDKSGLYYVDKLFGPNALFGQAFVFIVVFFFILIGLVYGFVARSIKVKDIPECLAYSLDRIGNVLVLLFVASLFVSTFKKTNIGVVLTALLVKLISGGNLTGLWLIFALLFISFISHLFNTGFALKWSIMSGLCVPLFMNASLSPEFSQIVFSLGSSLANGLTPLMAYFVIYVSFLQMYRKDNDATIFGAIKINSFYALGALLVFLLLIIIFYITGLPLGIGSMPGVNYVA